MSDMVKFTRDLAMDTVAYVKQQVDPLKAENAALRRRVAALEAKLAAVPPDRSFEKDDGVEPPTQDGWRQQGDDWRQ